MSKYSGLLKAKLQELLTSRGLPIDGTKEVLIERLEESDKIGAELDEEEEDVSTTTTTATAVTADEPTPSSAPVAEEEEAAPVEEVAEEAAEDTTEAAPVEEEAATVEEEVTPETLKAAAVDYLSKKIARAQKFGEDAQVATLQADLARIEKFGIALDSAIARELGYAPKKSEHKTPVYKHNNHRRNNNNRGGNRGGVTKAKPNPRRRSSNGGRYSYHGNDRYKTR